MLQSPLCAAYQVISNVEYCKINNERTDYEMIFSANNSESDASVIVEIEQALGNVHLDNIEFYEVDVDLTNPDDHILFEYNASAIVKTIALDKRYVDVNNKQYVNELSIAPYSSVILVSDGSPYPKKPQTILFADIDYNTIGKEPVAISAVASSELPVLLNVISGPGEIVDNTKIRFNNSGTVEIEALQSGNEIYEPTKAKIKIVYEGDNKLANADEFDLKAFPNPFKKRLQIEFTMPVSGKGTLALYDINGRLIHLIHEGFL
ncbi:MAG: hypothetical protein EOO85_32895, partial [Pedobacter sp.]